MRKTALLFPLVSFLLVLPWSRSTAAQVPEQGAGEQGAGEQGAGGEKKSWEKEPSFKNDTYRERFENGKELFEGGKYRQAGAEFSRAVRGAASREDREIVQKWRLAVKFVPFIERARKLVERKQHQQAYAYLQELRSRIEETPAMPIWKQLATELDGLLFVTLENFDIPRRNFPGGMSYVDDSEKVFRGRSSLHWKNKTDRSASALRVPNVPKSLKPFDAIELWVRSDKPVPVEVFILTEDPLAKPGAGGQAGQIVSSYMLPVTLQSPPGKWRRMELKLATFQIQGNASLDAVEDIQIQIRAGRTFDFFIDEIRLMKKNPAKKAPRGRRRR